MASHSHSEPESSDSSVKSQLLFNFRFTLYPAKLLKTAMFSLTDKDFNPNHRAMIQVGEPGFEITVGRVNESADETVLALLRLKAAGLEDFECINPIKKIVLLNSLSGSLDHFEDDDTVSVYNINLGDDEPDQLCFESGLAPDSPIELKLLDDDLGLPKFPNISYGYETVIASKDLKEMAESMLNLEPKHRPHCVSVEIKAKTRLRAGALEVKTVTANRYFTLIWRYWGMLVKATRSAEECAICLVTDPDKNAMLRFNFGEAGDLVVLHGQSVMNYDEGLLTCVGHFESLF